MSELRHASDYTTISGSGGGLYDTPESKGKGRFAHKQYKKSKSLCTLETNLDEVNFAASPTGDGLQRVPSAHELRISKSLQKLNVPNWYKQSSLSKSGSCLLKYGSSSSMSSWAFSPSLISSPCTTPSTTSNIVIKSRVQLPSSRNLRSPRFASKSAPSTPSFMNQSTEEKPATPTPVKLPSDKMRTKDKPKALMPIPIVPFDKIRAMFEKKDEQKTQKFQKDEGFATPVSSSTAATKTQAQRPTEIAPSKSFPLNGNDEARYTEEDVVPKVIVSPTDPNVKSILKRPNQEKRYSDIQEAPEADDEPVIVRPVPTKPHEAAPTMPVSQAPTFVSPPQPAKQQPPSKPPIKDKPVLAEKPRPGTAKPEQKEKDEPKPASAPREERTTKKQLKQEGQPSSGSKPKGFAFFRSLRSSSSSSTEDTKDKERKSPREKGIKSSVSPTLSPDSSNDSPEAFPASPFSRLSPTGVQSPPAITITPDTSRPKAPPPYVNVAPGGPRESVTVLESAPVITPPSQKQPAAGPATEERIAQAGSQKEPVRQNVPKNARSPDPIQETNLDDSIEYEIRPAKPEPVVEAASEKKKSWFPKSKLSKTTKPAEESSKPSTKPKVLDLQSKFEIQQLADEPRRLRSPTESASPNGSFVSEGSRSGNVHRESDRSRSPASYSQDGRFAARESDFDQSRDSFSSRSADRSRESDRRDTKLPERKPSEDSDRSFNRSLDQSSDRYPSRDNDHGSARGGKYSDRSAATDSRSGGSDRHISSEDDRRDRSRDSELSRSSDPRDESDRSFDSRDRGHDRDRDFDRSRDYDRRDRDYDDRSRDYNRRDRDYDDRGRDYDRRDRDYDRGRDTDKRDRDYVDRGRDYDRKDKDYDDRSRNFDRRDRNYDDRGTDYDRRDRDFDTRRRERETSPREGSIHSREFDRDSKRGADLDRSSLSRGSAVGSDVTRDSRFRRPSDNYEDVATSRTSLSSGRTWQPKPRGSRGSDSSPPKRVGTATEESTRSPVDSNGTSSPYRYRVAGSAFSSSRPDTAPGLNTPPSGRHEVGPASKSGTAAGAAKSLRETTV